MAELIWKDKRRPPTDANAPNNEHKATPDDPQYQLTIKERYPQETEHYATIIAHSHNWHNRLICGDKKDVLRALLPEFSASIDLIYIDPPFMTGKTFSSGNQVAYTDTWRNDLDAYLQWLYETLALLHALLTPTGSLYIHLDWRTIHYARIMLDEIFGTYTLNSGAGFKNEIIWHYQSGGRAQKYYARKHDTILLYTKSARYCFHSERVSKRRGDQKRNHMRKEIGTNGRISWSIRSAGRVYTYDEDSPLALTDVWSDISHLHQKDPERTGYATQKPTALLERIILVSSEPDDLVLDCCCGSGVTPLVAERLGRRWIASDKSELAIATTRQRLISEATGTPFVVQQLVERKKYMP